MSDKSTVKKEEKVIREVRILYLSIQDQIKSRLNEFKRIWKKGKEEDIFAELVFCLLTPQSKAKSCHGAVGCLLENDLLVNGNEKEIAKALKRRTRFHNTKARNIVLARKTLTENGNMSIKKIIAGHGDPKEAREWLVENIRGMGFKEASHFLRNIGIGEEFAILDRHILKNLKSLGVIEEIPTSLSRIKYLEIENKMAKFSNGIGIPMAHLDLLLWYKETGEVFK